MRRKALRTEFACFIFGITETAPLFIKKRNKTAYTGWLERHLF